MNNFESEYPFGNFLEYSKFDELSEFLQSHCQKKNTVNTMAKINNPIHEEDEDKSCETSDVALNSTKKWKFFEEEGKTWKICQALFVLQV